ncbi:hypothetical protein H2248_005783 [Termitomyces sp. 'cryptogamus']|nr:hypothetical protein H2248_005783 [Termitomyces sp. 'cryptogamus']
MVVLGRVPILFVAVALASQVLASPEPAESISARQLPGLNPNSVPQQCQSDCSSATSSVSSCTSLDCICKDTTISGLAQCLDCAVSIQNSGLDVQTAQSVIDNVISGCEYTGSPVNNVTISAKDSGSKDNGAAHSTVIGASALFVVALGAFVTLA